MDEVGKYGTILLLNFGEFLAQQLFYFYKLSVWILCLHKNIYFGGLSVLVYLPFLCISIDIYP